MTKLQQNIHQMGVVQRTRKSPFYDATVAWGVKGMSVYNHMLMPTWYESPEADYWYLMKNVTMWDVAVERQVEITGPDAAKLVQYLIPRDINKCRIGQCFYVPLVDEKGGVLNDPILLRLNENHFWLSLADSDILFWVKGLALGMGFDVSVIEPDVSPLAIQGPNAQAVTAALLGDWVEKVRFFRFKEFMLDDIPLLVARSGWSKQGGFELYLRDGSKGLELWERVAEAGKDFDIKPATPSTIERIESGLLSYGSDMTLENNPFEIGLDAYIDLAQPEDFVGKAALQKINADGVTQTIVGLVIDGERRPGNSAWWPLSKNGTTVGKVTSAIYSPRLEKNIALALVDVAMSGIDTRLEVAAEWGEAMATVAPLPFG